MSVKAKRKIVSFRLNVTVVKELDTLARKMKRTRTEVVERACEIYLAMKGKALIPNAAREPRGGAA